MKMRNLAIVSAVLVAMGLLEQAAGGGEAAATGPQPAWPEITATMKPWCYWWWMGSAVDPPNLSREFHRYRDAGMGGCHIIPIYGAKGCDARYIPYLSPKWMEMLATAVSEARRLGMDVDMTTGTGWCFGGPNVPPEQATFHVEAKVFDVPLGGRLGPQIDAKMLLAAVASSEEGKTIDVTDRIDAAGSLAWRPESGKWKLWVVSRRPPSQRVKRAAPGGEGFMLNPLYGEAIRHYLVRFSEVFEAYRGPKPRAMYHDSYEYSTNWSPDLFAEFQKRRGYRLQDHVPVLFGKGQDDRTARVKCDYRETASDLLTDNFMPAWVAWVHAHGMTTRNQAHGSPGNLLDLYAAADIPETEMFSHDREILVSKFASSAAHVANRPLVASETGTWLAEHFTETLGELKQLVDELFAAGINHVIYHGTCYSPDDAPWPGWLFYASTEMNPRNSIWHDAGALNAYIARCQSILQSGRPSNDLLLYWPIHDGWHQAGGMLIQCTVHHRDWLLKQPIGQVARDLWNRGFTFDYVSDRQVAEAKANVGEVVVPGGRYRAVVVPPCEHIPVPTLERLLALAAAAATVVFADHLPQDVPGLADLDARRAALKKLLATVTLQDVGQKLQGATLGKGQVLVGDVEAALARAGVERETLADHEGALLVRRTIAEGHDYFIANYGQKPMEGWITPARPAAAAALMDPMTGRTGWAATRSDPAGRLQVYLQLPPGASIVLRAYTSRQAAGEAWPYVRPSGEPIPIAGTWHVRFLQGGPAIPKPLDATKLASWTELGGEEAQRFAGTALYAIEFDAAAPGCSFLLDLGKVCQSARVRLNGRDLAVLFASPMAVVVDGLKPKGNLLEVEVTSVAANRIRDLDRRHVAWKNFNDINFVNLAYRPFDASNWPIRDAGLLGPVTLRPVEIGERAVPK